MVAFTYGGKEMITAINAKGECWIVWRDSGAYYNLNVGSNLVPYGAVGVASINADGHGVPTSDPGATELHLFAWGNDGSMWCMYAGADWKWSYEAV